MKTIDDLKDLDPTDFMQEEHAERIGSDRIAFMTMNYDQWMDNPLEMDPWLGTIHSFNSNHINFLKLLAPTKEKALEELHERFDKPFFVLGYFEHGPAIDWHLAGYRPPGTEIDYRWDGNSFAGVWVPSDGQMKEVEGLDEDEKEEKLRKFANHACKQFSYWARGEIYYYGITLFELLRSPAGTPKTDPGSYAEEQEIARGSLTHVTPDTIRESWAETIDILKHEVERYEKKQEEATSFEVEFWANEVVTVRADTEEEAMVKAVRKHGWPGAAEHTTNGQRFQGWVRPTTSSKE